MGSKACKRKSQNASASRKYRHKNKEEYNRKARERMARRRSEQSDLEKKIYKNIQCEYSSTGYIRNRDIILDKAQEARHAKYFTTHGTLEDYPLRNVRPRYLLGVRDPGTTQSKHLYEKKVAIWKLEKKESQAKKADEVLERKMDLAQMALEEEEFLKLVHQYELAEGRRFTL